MKTVIEISGNEFERKLRAATKPVLVHFYASWSGRCRILDPSLERLAAEMGAELQVAKLNLDQYPQLARSYGVAEVPALILFEDGSPVACLDASMSSSQMKVDLQGLLADYVLHQ